MRLKWTRQILGISGTTESQSKYLYENQVAVAEDEWKARTCWTSVEC